jgi:NAD(P)H-dependent FMN reductase
MAKSTYPTPGKRALPIGSRAVPFHITLSAYHGRLALRAMQRHTMSKSRFFSSLIDQALGANVSLLQGLSVQGLSDQKELAT